MKTTKAKGARRISFLQLPAEIRYVPSPPPQPIVLTAPTRVMIYERIRITTRLHAYNFAVQDDEHEQATGAKPKSHDSKGVILIIKSLPVSLLRTCKQIHHEATPVLQPLLEKLSVRSLRIFAGAEALRPFLSMLTEWYTNKIPIASTSSAQIANRNLSLLIHVDRDSFMRKLASWEWGTYKHEVGSKHRLRIEFPPAESEERYREIMHERWVLRNGERFVLGAMGLLTSRQDLFRGWARDQDWLPVPEDDEWPFFELLLPRREDLGVGTGEDGRAGPVG